MPAMDEHGNTYPSRSNEMEEYKQYESAPVIADQWRSEPKMGLCDFCGLDDAPIVFGHPSDTDVDDVLMVFADVGGAQSRRPKAKCKWCAELDDLNYHLQHNGERRMVEINKTLNPDMHWSIKVFCVLVTIYVLYVIFVSGTH